MQALVDSAMHQQHEQEQAPYYDDASYGTYDGGAEEQDWGPPPPSDPPPAGDLSDGEFHAPPPSEPHHDDLILGPARLQRQSKHDPAHFESLQFALAHGAEEGALLQFWRPDLPQQMESFPAHLIQRLLKGFDEEARRYSTESTRELQVEWNKFPHITGSRTEYLRLRADSLQVRAAWLKHLSQQTGLVAEDPTEHLHTKPLAQPVGPAPSLNLGLRVTHADAAPSRSHGADDDSSEDEMTNAAICRSPRDGERSRFSHARGLNSAGLSSAAGSRAEPAAPPSWSTHSVSVRVARVPPGALEDAYRDTILPSSPNSEGGSPPARASSPSAVRAHVVSSQLRRQSRAVERRTRASNLQGGARFERMEKLDAHLTELRQQRGQRRGTSTVGAARARTTVGIARDDAVREDVFQARSRRTDLQSRLASMQDARSGSPGGHRSAQTLLSELGRGRTSRVKRLHISLGEGSTASRMLFDPKISAGAFERLLRRQLGLDASQPVSLAEESSGRFLSAAEALQLENDATVLFSSDSPPPSPPPSDDEDDEPPAQPEPEPQPKPQPEPEPEPELEPASGDGWLPDEEPNPENGDFPADGGEDGGWQGEDDYPPPRYKCIKKAQAREDFEGKGKKTCVIKKGQEIVALEWRENEKGEALPAGLLSPSCWRCLL